MLEVQCSMFDVYQFLFRLDRPFFWPAAGLNTEHSKRSLTAKPNRLAALQFDVWTHEVSLKSNQER